MRASPRTDRVPLAAPLLETRLNGRAPHRQGKVRDIYDVDGVLLMVATDRISAFWEQSPTIRKHQARSPD